MKVVAFVPAKSSSQRIVNKNLAVLDGEHLFKRKLRQLLECPEISEVYLDTDSDSIAALASDLPIRHIKRPVELATNATDGHELFAWECSQVEADIYIQVLCTAPFVTSDTVSRALHALLSSKQHDSVVAVTNTKQYLWNDGIPLYGKGRIPNSIDLPPTTVEAMSLYMVKKSDKPIKRRFGDNPMLFELNPTENIDVNWPEDLELAEVIASGHRSKENLALTALSPYLNSALISDITRDMNLGNLALPKEICGSGRFIGRAKTLMIDRCHEGEDWRGIYDALDTYQFIRPGDVIMVENKIKDRAYFGSLNAQLALRAGAVGAVIDGVTRDRWDVEKLGFAVHALGHYCVDIKFEGTVRSMNMPIQMGGVTVNNGDYVVADADGVVVIPKQHWPVIYDRIILGIEKEFKVGMSVAMGVAPSKIFQSLGEF